MNDGDAVYINGRSLRFRASESTDMYIHKSGNVTIGQGDNSNGKLQVNGDVFVTGNIYATGEISAGGAGDSIVDIMALVNRVASVENIVQNISEAPKAVEIKVSNLSSYDGKDVVSTILNNVGLTNDVINNLIAGKYTKVIDKTNSTYHQVWEYSARNTSTGRQLFFRIGDGTVVAESYNVSYNNNKAKWNITHWTA
jgi:hypothetical protein